MNKSFTNYFAYHLQRMEHKASTSSTQYKLERKWSLFNALAKELADIGDEINERFSYRTFDSLSNEVVLIKTFSNSNPMETFQHSDYLRCKCLIDNSTCNQLKQSYLDSFTDIELKFIKK
ncbi:unnamed protein product [Schistosoma turkestanicum]|nr:unnamed protein product [Schistosoma turkestanicum]